MNTGRWMLGTAVALAMAAPLLAQEPAQESAPAQEPTPKVAPKNCDELKSEIAARLDAKGVKNYSLEAVPTADVQDRKVVGSCQGGTMKIVYTRNSG